MAQQMPVPMSVPPPPFIPSYIPLSARPTTSTTTKPAAHNQQPKRRKSVQQRHMSMKKLIPFTEVEWKYVQKKFMSSEEEDLKMVCDIMNGWINRMCHDTPVFVDISELMFRALLLEKRHRNAAFKDLSLLDNTDVGLIYGSVIIRFINYLNEICQPGGAAKMSIATAVSKMKIPGWIVSVRHKATHGQMPPMNQMKDAIKHCRNWLWREYWSKPLTDAIKQTIPGLYEQQQEQKKSYLGNRMVNALQCFREWRRRYPNLSEFHAAVDRKSQGQYSPQAPEKCRLIIETLLEECAEEFISYFVLICLAQFPEDPDGDVFGKENGRAAELLRGTPFSKEKHVDKINQHEQKFYGPVFALMNAKGCLPGLLIEITRLLSYNASVDFEMEMSSRQHLAGWGAILLSAFMNAPSTVSAQNWRIVLRHIFLAPQYFLDEHIERLLSILTSDGVISEECRRRLARLLKKIQVEDADCSSNSLLDYSTQSVRTLNDLQDKIRREEEADQTFVRDPLTLEDDWSLASPDELGPLGLTADQRVETLCLALDVDLYI